MLKLVYPIPLAALLLGGCPTQPNPALADADVDALRDADADADVGGDADVEVDGDTDADHVCSQQNQAYCDGACVPVNTKSRCGDCETQCETFTSCRCEPYEGSYRCWSNSDSTTCEAR
jgi:hypothetical protein